MTLTKNQSEISPALTNWEPGGSSGLDHRAEWVLAMGNGSMAMGAIDGTPTRRYHGLLIASQSPPVQRANLVSAMDESVSFAQEHCCTPELDVRLTRFRFGDDDSAPKLMPGLVGFEHDHQQCSWTYHIPTQQGAISIRKTLVAADRINACILTYEIQSPVDATMNLTPLLGMRDYHELNFPGSISTESFDTASLTEPGVSGVRVSRESEFGKLEANLRGLHIEWNDEPSIYSGIRLDRESERGQSDIEDLYAPGHWNISIKKGVIQTVQIEMADRQIDAVDWNACIDRKHDRLSSSVVAVLNAAGNPEDPSLRDTLTRLAVASDAYVVDRSDTTSIIAGYPWFSDWGRDTMIALPGLLLDTGRHDEALRTLMTFAKAREHGLIPNRFDDDAGPAHYNTVDASLWFVHACHQWCEATGNPMPSELKDACRDVIDAYLQGTIHNIKVDPTDGLVCAGSEETQLTWMDAQRNGITFTPRHGKPIEIQALWINALRSFAIHIDADQREQLITHADLAQESLCNLMSKGPSGGLVDCLTPLNHSRGTQWERSNELRPNQIFALSLPYVQLPIALRDDSIKAMWDSLVTPAGMRTLAPSDPNYHPHYRGPLMELDAAYHTGTVWPWLLGPACEALMRTQGFEDHSRATTIQLLTELASKMHTDSVGQIHEVYDAEADESGHQHPNGCPAQAWSVAETLRVLILASRP